MVLQLHLRSNRCLEKRSGFTGIQLSQIIKAKGIINKVDITVILWEVFQKAWFLIPLAMLAALIKSSWFKGIIGEALVNISTKLLLNKEEYHLIKNVTLPTNDGTTQIDHIIVSKFGIFVVETKNMKGWIFGKEQQKMWTQKIFKSSHKFQNPLHQNYKHIKTLQECLNIDESKLFSVIVFVGDSSFKTEMPKNVTYGSGYARFIKSKKEIVFTVDEVQDILSQIHQGRLKSSLKTSRDHVRHVKKIVENKKLITYCPKCGSDMVERETTKGTNKGSKFLGCSAFPKCRSIQPIN